jgi:hypothetical protein
VGDPPTRCLPARRKSLRPPLRRAVRPLEQWGAGRRPSKADPPLVTRKERSKFGCTLLGLIDLGGWDTCLTKSGLARPPTGGRTAHKRPPNAWLLEVGAICLHLRTLRAPIWARLGYRASG